MVGCLLCYLAMTPLEVYSQQASQVIEPYRVMTRESSLESQVLALRDAGKLMTIEDVESKLNHPQQCEVKLQPTLSIKLTADQIEKRLRESTLQVGWYYLCHACDKWHLNLGGGYVLESGGIAGTCYHVLAPGKDTMREGFAIAVDYRGRVHPVTQIIASDATLDCAVFKIEGVDSLIPLSVNDQTVVGESTYVLSNPLGLSGYFSEGIINRFNWLEGREQGDPMKFEDAKHLRITVSNSWAPGSSGSPIVDSCGNLIGHVSTLAAFGLPADTNDKSQGGNRRIPRQARQGQLQLHEASPARGLLLMLQQGETNVADDSSSEVDETL